jgi:hypothetical protein
MEQKIVMSSTDDLYSEAHLFVAAVRVLTHQKKKAPPSLAEICQTLFFSEEWGAMMCRDLKRLGVIDTVEDSYQTRVYVADHSKLEEIPRHEKEAASGFDKELAEYQKKRQDLTSKAEAIQSELARKKKDLFADLENKLKKQNKE